MNYQKTKMFFLRDMEEYIQNHTRETVSIAGLLNFFGRKYGVGKTTLMQVLEYYSEMGKIDLKLKEFKILEEKK